MPKAEKNGGKCCFKMRSRTAILVVARNKEESGDKLNHFGDFSKILAKWQMRRDI